MNLLELYLIIFILFIIIRMGNQICNRDGPNQEIQLKQNNLRVKFNRKQVKYVKSSIDDTKTPLLSGFVKLYKLQSQTEELIYEGEMKRSKFDGFGKLYKGNQLIYEGQFKNNLYDGWGVTPIYSGEFKEGIYDGYGIQKLVLQDRDQTLVTFYYEGYFQNGLYSGMGVSIKDCKLPAQILTKIHDTSGMLDYINAQIQHGLNLIKQYAAKEIYIGQFSYGFRHGFGRLFSGDTQFSGQFSRNLYHGLGTTFDPNNRQGKKVVQGVFKMGKPVKV